MKLPMKAAVAGLTLAALVAAAASAADTDMTLRTLVQRERGASTGLVRKGRTVQNLGNVVGVYMDIQLGEPMGPGDRGFHDKAARDALWRGPTGTTVSWKNYRSKSTGRITARAPATLEAGAICRLFEDAISVRGGEEIVRSARICLGPDHIWRIG